MASICVRLQGLPLAIELAAVRVRVLPPDKLLERLTKRLDLLTGGAADREARQQTLRGAIAWSYDLLTGEEQTLFRRLAVLTGGTFEAIEAICAADGNLDVLDGLESLVAKSLLRQEEGADGPRFFMLETIREFALERLEESGEAEAIRQGHAAVFLALAERAEPYLTGLEQASWLNRLEADHDNLRAALEWFEKAQQAEAELRLAAALWRFWDMRGYLTEGRHRLQHALAHGGEVQPALKAKALDGAGLLAWVLGESTQAIALHEEALALSQAAKDARGIARSSGYLGQLAAATGDFDRAIPLYEEALAIYRLFGDRRGSAAALYALSNVAVAQEHWDKAQTLAEESRMIWQQLGEPAGSALVIQLLGRIAWHRGDSARAAELYERSLAVWKSLDNRSVIAHDLINLGRALQRQGDPERPAALFAEALALARDIGELGAQAFALYSIGHLSQVQGATDRARTLFTQASEIYQGIGETTGLIWCLESLAAVLASDGQATEAAITLGAAKALRDEFGIPLETILRDDHERTVEAVRAAFDEATYLEALAIGRIMSPGQVIAEVGTNTS